MNSGLRRFWCRCPKCLLEFEYYTSRLLECPHPHCSWSARLTLSELESWATEITGKKGFTPEPVEYDLHFMMSEYLVRCGFSKDRSCVVSESGSIGGSWYRKSRCENIETGMIFDFRWVRIRGGTYIALEASYKKEEESVLNYGCLNAFDEFEMSPDPMEGLLEFSYGN